MLPLPSEAPPEPLASGGQIHNLAGEKLSSRALTGGRVWPGMRLSFLTAFAHDDRGYFITTEHLVVPIERMRIAKLAAFAGVELTREGEAADHLPLIWPAWKPAHVFRLGERGAVSTDYEIAVQERASISANETWLGSEKYYELLAPPAGAPSGQRYLVRAKQVARALKVDELPPGVGKDEVWIDVSIMRQVLVLYRGLEPLYATLVSTGVDGAQDPEKTKSTIRGLFRIHKKHVTTRMKGDEQPAKSTDGEPDQRYRVDDVPYVQFFAGSFALHGAYWHDAFGQPKSHGCINLSPRDALYLFERTEPKVPEQWHGVLIPAEGKGTPVSIHID